MLKNIEQKNRHNVRWKIETASNWTTMTEIYLKDAIVIQYIGTMLHRNVWFKFIQSDSKPWSVDLESVIQFIWKILLINASCSPPVNNQYLIFQTSSYESYCMEKIRQRTKWATSNTYNTVLMTEKRNEINHF